MMVFYKQLKVYVFPNIPVSEYRARSVFAGHVIVWVREPSPLFVAATVTPLSAEGVGSNTVGNHG